MGVPRLRNPIVVSILIHVLFASVCAFWLAHRSPSAPAGKITWIEVEPFDAQAIARKVEARKAIEEENKRRIVQTAPGRPTREPAPDAFLGEKTQTVDRQTVSKNRLTTIGQQAQAKSQPRREESRKETPAPLKQLGLAILPKAKPPGEAEQFQDRVQAHDSTGMPQDYVKGFKESESTALNTQEFVFYGYFQRIRQRLDLTWSRTLREHLVKMYRGGRQLASDMDHLTRILVTLDSAGEITRVQVVGESGTHDLDEAAVRAFNQAGPFPNPPHGILDPTGQIKIRWDFVLRT